VKGIRLMAVIAGLATSMVATIVLKFGAASIVSLTHESFQGLLWWALSMLVVALAEGMGGFVAARSSAPNRIGAALVVGLIDLALTGWFVFHPSGTAWAWWMTAVSVVLVVPSAMGGGYLARGATGLTSAST